MVKKEGAPSPDWRAEAALRSFHFNLTTAEEGSRGLEPLHGFPKAQSQAVNPNCSISNHEHPREKVMS